MPNIEEGFSNTKRNNICASNRNKNYRLKRAEPVLLTGFDT
jgi:hypothetical protein